jgi:hypothetical protein
VRIDVHEHLFHGDFRRRRFVDDVRDVAGDDAEPHRQAVTARANAAAGDIGQRVAVLDDEAETGDAQPRIDAEDAAGRRDRGDGDVATYASSSSADV